MDIDDTVMVVERNGDNHWMKGQQTSDEMGTDIGQNGDGRTRPE